MGDSVGMRKRNRKGGSGYKGWDMIRVRRSTAERIRDAAHVHKLTIADVVQLAFDQAGTHKILSNGHAAGKGT